ncbi:hypothetical protein PCE1_004441 [Barthelona sp. PCE]
MGKSKTQLKKQLRKDIRDVEKEYKPRIKKARREEEQRLMEELDARIAELERECRVACGEEPVEPETETKVEEEEPSTTITEDVMQGGFGFHQIEMRETRAQKRRRKQKEKQKRDLDERIRIAALDTPSKRERRVIDTTLKAEGLRQQGIQADGNCLYRSIGFQINREQSQLRVVAADYLLDHRDEYCHFVLEDFDQYIEKVRNTHEWGTHLEIQALSNALDLHIAVYQDGETLHFNEHNETLVRIAYLKHAFPTGEHFNAVIKA